jgi:hypothetical protein
MALLMMADLLVVSLIIAYRPSRRHETLVRDGPFLSIAKRKYRGTVCVLLALAL